MPSFLKELRKRSRSNFRAAQPVVDATHDCNGDLPSENSSSTNGSSTPPTALPSDDSSSSLRYPIGASPPVPPRPGVVTKRYSLHGMSIHNGSPKTSSAPSPLAPRVLSVSDNSWVHQKVLLVYGQIGDPSHRLLDGSVTVCHHQDSFPPITWPVNDSHFKALVHLQPGPNRLRLDFIAQKPASSVSPTPHSSWININLLPLNCFPPLQLAIILARDSPETYDAVPERVQREGNGLETAIRKFRMAAYLWQAFTGEQMNRHGFGRRCFRFEEEWQPGTLTFHDTESRQMRNEAKIHILRSDKSVKELQDLELAQQYEPASRKGDLYNIAMDAVRAHFKPKPDQPVYVSCMFLDTHWDPSVGTVRGHAALGGGSDDVKLAIFGSHALQSYPASLEEVVPAFLDCTRTDTKYVANDCNESGSSWEAANIGIGAHLHETGHLFGCPHQESGVMLRDYVYLNRTFVCKEAYCTRTKSPGQKLCLQRDECAWHRLDCLRFRYHPCFRLPTDLPQSSESGVQVWTVENGSILVTAATGIAWIELFAEGDDVCKSHIEYLDPGNNSLCPRQINIAESELRARLPENKRNKRLTVHIHTTGNASHTIDDFSHFASTKNSKLKLPDGRCGFRGSKLGLSQLEGSEPQEVILDSIHIQTKLLTCIRVYHGFAIDGIEFIYEDMTTQLFGKRGGTPGGSDFPLDTRRGEHLIGFHLRSGAWIDGVQILTSLGRRSEIFGNASSGSGCTLLPPRGYSIAGISGSCGSWLDGFALVITR